MVLCATAYKDVTNQRYLFRTTIFSFRYDFLFPVLEEILYTER